MTKKQAQKTKRINLRITPGQLKALRKLAKEADTTLSGAVMALIGMGIADLKSE